MTDPAQVAVVWALSTLAAHRLWRLVAVDDLPGWRDAADRVEGWVAGRFGDRWAAGIRCAWCSGWWACVAVIAAVDLSGVSMPLWPVQMAAASTVVGLIGAPDG